MPPFGLVACTLMFFFPATFLEIAVYRIFYFCIFHVQYTIVSDTDFSKINTVSNFNPVLVTGVNFTAIGSREVC